MIFLDVTGGCTLPLQAGIPRTTRELARLARQRLRDLLPIRWQPFRRSYTHLSRRAAALLEDRVIPTRPPRDATVPLLLGALSDLALPWPAAVHLHHTLCATDTLVLTSLFPDNRLACLETLTGLPARKVALFHDAIPLRDPLVPAWEKRRHVRGLRLLVNFDLIVAVSAAARADLLALAEEHRLPTPRTVVVRWPVPFRGVRPPFAPPPPVPTVLCVSRLKRTKNHAALLAACEGLWNEGLDFSLRLIGCEDEPRESSAVRHEVRRLAAGGRSVSWHAQVTEEDLHAAYRAAAFTVFPSQAEGFGLPILESFWHGRGVICSNLGSMGEISSGPGALAVDVARPAEIAAAMRPLLREESARLALARAAHARPLRNWEDYWNEFEPCLAAA